MTLPNIADVKIAVIGLGYVGFPLAVYLARKFTVVGFDIDSARIAELERGTDYTREVTEEELVLATGLSFTTSHEKLKDCNFYIVTVPTPIDSACRPELSSLEKASETVGRAISPGNVVVYESTVYPGATEEVCLPIIERFSGLSYKRDFHAGYSPERINPGDRLHHLPSVKKITSGSSPEVANLVDQVYAAVISAGTHRTSSIRVAEAAKVIENIQRDLNIALVNELAQIFKKLGLETREVLEAAGTKWNFHHYRPGLVGGHCIGVDPYYLTHKAQSIGFHPEIILAGRRVNDGMAVFVANDIVKTMVARKLPVGNVRLLVMGFTFKENCPDTRNTKVSDLVKELQPFAREVAVWDPYADPRDVVRQHAIEISNSIPDGRFDGIVLAVKHEKIMALGGAHIRSLLTSPSGFIYDLKEVLPVAESDARI